MLYMDPERTPSHRSGGAAGLLCTKKPYHDVTTHEDGDTDHEMLNESRDPSLDEGIPPERSHVTSVVTSRRPRLTGLVRLRYCLAVDVIVLIILGCSSFGAGLYVRLGPVFQDLSTSLGYVLAASYGLLAVGSLVVVTAAIGSVILLYYRRQNRALLGVFFTLLLTIFLLLLTTGCWAVAQTTTLESAVTASLRQSIQRYNSEEGARHYTDSVQRHMNCCGVDNGYSDYALYSEGMVANNVCTMQYFGQPCAEPLLDFLIKHLVLLSALTVTLLVFLLMGMLITVLMTCAVYKQRPMLI